MRRLINFCDHFTLINIRLWKDLILLTLKRIRAKNLFNNQKNLQINFHYLVTNMLILIISWNTTLLKQVTIGFFQTKMKEIILNISHQQDLILSWKLKIMQ